MPDTGGSFGQRSTASEGAYRVSVEVYVVVICCLVGAVSALIIQQNQRSSSREEVGSTTPSTSDSARVILVGESGVSYISVSSPQGTVISIGSGSTTVITPGGFTVTTGTAQQVIRHCTQDGCWVHVVRSPGDACLRQWFCPSGQPCVEYRCN